MTITYNYTKNLNYANGYFLTKNEAQSTSSSTLEPTGFYTITETNYLYQFGTNIYNLNSNDLLMNDNGGALRRILTPNIPISNLATIPNIINGLSGITLSSYGTHSGTQSSSGSITFSSSNGTSLISDYALVAFQSATTLCNLTISVPSNGNITITFKGGAGNYVLSYLTFSTG